ncbi:MAG: hypothetical protein J1F37_03900 [Oscillospiraceae bacterium]|nr:hypothetical protein [Oscillospiraceae bacterium]
MKICDKCSVANDDKAVFCTGCGAVLPNDNGQENGVNQASTEAYEQPQASYAQPQQAYSQPQPPFVQPVGSQPAYSTPPYSQPYGYATFNENMLPEEYKPVTVGQYIGYSILFGIPIIGIIMLFVTAFGSDKSKSLRNFAKANLVLYAIGVVLAIIWVVFAGALVTSTGYYY